VGQNGDRRLRAVRRGRVRADDGDPAIPGNPWIICTLWLARHAIEAATRREELEPARRLLDWVAARAAPSGVLPEQVDPFDGAARSVAPLTWSHAEFILTARRLVERCAEFVTPATVPTQEEATRCAKP
jgi:GH15 family glucan-1,4-alpha-glucosidase